MADGLHIAKCLKRYKSPTNALIGMKLGWSHPIMSPTYPPWCGCHGNGRCLATAYCTFSSYGRLEAERVNQFCWNLVHNRKLGPRWQSHDQILKFLKFKMADGCHVGKKLKCHNSPTNWPTGMQLWWSHPIIFSKCPPCCGSWQRRGALNILLLDRTREPILMKFGKQQLVRTTLTVSWSNIKIFKIQNGGRPPCWKYSKCRNSPTNWPTVTQLGSSHPIMFSTCPPCCGCNGALDIQQLRASEGRTREPILMKFGIRQQIRTPIQNGGRSLLENSRNAITRLPMDRLGRNLGGCIPSCSQYCKCYNSSYDGTNWDDSWVAASKQHICCKTVSFLLHSERFGFMVCRVQKHPQFWWNLDDCATVVQIK